VGGSQLGPHYFATGSRCAWLHTTHSAAALSEARVAHARQCRRAPRCRYLGFSKDASERGGRRSLLGHAGTATHVPGVQGGLTGVRLRAQGHPFNAALRENRAMVRTLQYGGIGFALLVLDLVPGMNGAMSLVSARPGVDCIPAHATAHAAFPA